MSENENKVCPVSCKIEHHAMMFAHGDELTTMTNQAYGEWENQITPDKWTSEHFAPNRHFRLTLQNVHGVKHWKKHNITEYGKYYCVNVDTFGQEYLDVLDGLYPVE